MPLISMRRPGLPSVAGLAAICALAGVGCAGGGSHGAAPPGSPTTASTGEPSRTGVPNPFTVIARYRPASLGLHDPANLAIGADGNLYVTDASQHVTVISPHGHLLRRWGRSGKGAGEFSFVTHEAGVPGVSAPIAVGSDGLVYVVDTGHPRVEVFAQTGAFIRQFGGPGVGRGQFLFPSAIAVDGGGNVYVADDQQETISKFSPSGAVEWRIGGASSNYPDLIGHFHLATLDSHGRLVALNDDAERTLYINARGGTVDGFESGGCDVTVDAAGYTYVNGCQEPLLSPHDTRVFDRNHRLVGEWDHSGFGWSPRFGPNGEIFTLGEDGSILRLKVDLPDA
jgi:DNA-binding beta-propeller fold protein YncE